MVLPYDKFFGSAGKLIKETTGTNNWFQNAKNFVSGKYKEIFTEASKLGGTKGKIFAKVANMSKGGRLAFIAGNAILGIGLTVGIGKGIGKLIDKAIDRRHAKEEDVQALQNKINS